MTFLKFVTIRIFKEILKFVKFEFSIYGINSSSSGGGGGVDGSSPIHRFSQISTGKVDAEQTLS